MTTSAENEPEAVLDTVLEPLGEVPVNNSLDDLLNTHFAARWSAKTVGKDLTKLIREGANVPVYLLKYLLGMYCASNDEETIQNGLLNVKRS